MFFPEEFNSSKTKEYYDQLRQRTILELQGIKTGNRDHAAIAKIDEFLLFFSKPSIFSGKKSIEVKFEKQFEEVCILITEQTGSDAKQLTVSAFYSALDYIKKKAKANKKAANKSKGRRHGR